MYLQITTTSITIDSSNFVDVAATFLSSTQITCTRPDVSISTVITITNDEVNFSSTQVAVLNIDPKCLSCNILDGTCTQTVSDSYIKLIMLFSYNVLGKDYNLTDSVFPNINVAQGIISEYLQNKSCIIDDVCYQYGDPNPEDETQICFPESDPAGWTSYTGQYRSNTVCFNLIYMF